MNDDLFSHANALAADPADNAPTPGANVLTVSEISNQLRRLVEGRFAHVAVEGEISGLKVAASGHAYLNLKDEETLLAAVIWRGSMQKINIPLEDGQHVVAYGRITTYSGRSTYQLVIDRLELAGLGALLQRFEALKKQLATEGLFEAARKKPLPLLPQKIGIITSPTGAVIDDMLSRLQSRFPRDVLLWPVAVQGPGAKEQIAAAIDGMNRLPAPQRPDVLIVARGGGSLEDLWAFNEEIVVRAVANSAIPVISGVGHEPDVTLCDYAADHRAATPTAAAVDAVPDRRDLWEATEGLKAFLRQATTRTLRQHGERVTYLARMLPAPHMLLAQARLKIDDRATRLNTSLQALVRHKQQQTATAAAGLKPGVLRQFFVRHTLQTRSVQGRLKNAITRLLTHHAQTLARTTPALAPRRMQARLQQAGKDLGRMEKLLLSLSPNAPLARGYAYVTDAAGHVVKSASTQAADVTLHFHDGKRKATLRHS